MSRQTETDASLAASLATDARRGIPLLPWSLVGMGLFIAWLSCTHLRGGFVFVGPNAQAGALADYLMRAGDIGTLLLAAAFAHKLGPLSQRRRMCACLTLLCVLGTALAPLSMANDWPTPVFGLACVCAGIGGAALLLVWAEVYSRLGATRCLVFGSISCVLAGVCAFFVSAMAYEVSCLACVLLPIASAFLAGISLSRLPADGDEDGSRGTARTEGVPHGASIASYPVPWKLVLLMALAGFGSGFAGSILVSDDGIGAVHRIEATVLFGLVVLAILLARRGSFDMRLVAWWTLPLSILSFVLIPACSATSGAVVSFLVKYSYVSFSLFVLVMLASICHRHAIPSMRVFASARAASEVAMFAGIVLRRGMRASGMFDDATMLWAIAVVGLVAIMGCVLLWHSERSVTSDWGATGIDPASGAQVKTDRELLLERAEAIAAAHGLTPREGEVLSLIAQRHDFATVESELFMSHNTLKTHVHHIYGKTGAHSRDELVALVEGAAVTGRKGRP